MIAHQLNAYVRQLSQELFEQGGKLRDARFALTGAGHTVDDKQRSVYREHVRDSSGEVLIGRADNIITDGSYLSSLKRALEGLSVTVFSTVLRAFIQAGAEGLEWQKSALSTRGLDVTREQGDELIVSDGGHRVELLSGNQFRQE